MVYFEQELLLEEIELCMQAPRCLARGANCPPRLLLDLCTLPAMPSSHGAHSLLGGFCACDHTTATIGQQLWGLGSRRSSFQGAFLRLCLILQFGLTVLAGLILTGAQGHLLASLPS